MQPEKAEPQTEATTVDPQATELIVEQTEAARSNADGRCDHCLRSVFTRRMDAALTGDRGPTGGRIINLVAPPGQGQARLLDDLQRLAQPQLRLRASLKHYRRNLRGLVQALWCQTGATDPPPDDFAAFCGWLKQARPQPVLLLDDADSLFAETELDPGYNSAFLDELNALANAGVGLMLVSRIVLDRMVMLTREDDVPGSVLNLTRVDLPTLRHDELKAEIDRLALPLEAAGRALLADRVLGCGDFGWELLERAGDRLRDGVDRERPLAGRLDDWERAMRKDHKKLSTRSLSRVRDTAIAGWRLLGGDRLVTLLRKLKDLLPKGGDGTG